MPCASDVCSSRARGSMPPTRMLVNTNVGAVTQSSIDSHRETAAPRESRCASGAIAASRSRSTSKSAISSIGRSIASDRTSSGVRTPAPPMTAIFIGRSGGAAGRRCRPALASTARRRYFRRAGSAVATRPQPGREEAAVERVAGAGRVDGFTTGAGSSVSRSAAIQRLPRAPSLTIVMRACLSRKRTRRGRAVCARTALLLFVEKHVVERRDQRVERRIVNSGSFQPKSHDVVTPRRAATTRRAATAHSATARTRNARDARRPRGSATPAAVRADR